MAKCKHFALNLDFVKCHKRDAHYYYCKHYLSNYEQNNFHVKYVITTIR